MNALVLDAWRSYPAISLRSLALYRVCLGSLAAYAIVRRWVVWELFYSAEGVYPGAAIAASAPGRLSSILEGLDVPLAIHFVFGLALAIALAFAAGFAMRFTRWLLLPALITIHLRVPALLTGAEGVIHHQALIASLLPWSSLGKRRGRGDLLPAESDSVGELGVRTWIYPLMLFQLALIYFITAITKRGDSWMDGTAVFRSFAAPTQTTALGGLIGEALSMPILRALSFGTLVIEAALPLLILTPFARRKAHAIAALLIVVLHGAILLTLEVGIFSASMLVHLPLLWHPAGREPLRLLGRARFKRALEAGLFLALVYTAIARAGRDNFAMPVKLRPPLPALIERATNQLALGQLWQMFAPEPPARDRVFIVEAITEGGRVFDPWGRAAMRTETPARTLERSAIRSRLFGSYEFLLHPETQAPLAPFLSRWILKQELRIGEGERDPVERFDAWFITVSTESRERLLPDAELDEALRVMRLPMDGAVRVQRVEARGVWEAERAVDGLIVPDGTDSRSPVVSPMSAGCPYLILDLGEPQPLRGAFIQAAAADHFYLEGSLDGERYERIGEAARMTATGLRSRLLSLAGTWRYIRIRPGYARHSRHHLAEIALFAHELDEQAAAIPEVATEGSWRYSRERPSIVSAFSAANKPPPSCEAEALTAR